MVGSLMHVALLFGIPIDQSEPPELLNHPVGVNSRAREDSVGSSMGTRAQTGQRIRLARAMAPSRSLDLPGGSRISVNPPARRTPSRTSRTSRHACSACARRRGGRSYSCRPAPRSKPYRATTEAQQGRTGRARTTSKGTLGQVSNGAVDEAAIESHAPSVLRSEDDSLFNSGSLRGRNDRPHRGRNSLRLSGGVVRPMSRATFR